MILLTSGNRSTRHSIAHAPREAVITKVSNCNAKRPPGAIAYREVDCHVLLLSRDGARARARFSDLPLSFRVYGR